MSLTTPVPTPSLPDDAHDVAVSGHAHKTVRKADERTTGSQTKLRIDRHFTVAGQDPFASFHFVQRQSRIANPDGSVVFEMDDVEVPDFWDQVAVDILASKYFRKTGVPQTDANGQLSLDEASASPLLGPERSVKQVALRLANAWRIWGERGEYFASEQDAEAFRDEMAYMIVAQMGAPNSPQWFNTGLFEAYGIISDPEGNVYVDPATGEVCESPHKHFRSAASACYIQSVDDELVGDGSIMDLWEREARLFKAGSGSGTNYSNLRGKGESLSGGGTSSGMMSFIRVGDRAAGAIKSGGTTRRAARMVIVDADHPDVEEFIWCKAHEEEKAAALMAAGYSGGMDGEAVDTVAFQNGNNSVRITEGFMDAVANGAEWELTARTDGSTVKELPARSLWYQIADAAWRCADPGVQFDDILNDWNTVADSERLRGTNPCFTGDTRVHTDRGLLRFEDLLSRAQAGETFRVYTHNATSPDAPESSVELSSPEAYMVTGLNAIVKLKFSNGAELRCTPNHRIWTDNRGYVRADELVADDEVHVLDVAAPSAMGSYEFAMAADARVAPGERVKSRYMNKRVETQLPEKWSEELAHLFGWLLGDGCISVHQPGTSANHATTSLVYGGEEEQTEILPKHRAVLESITGGQVNPVELGNGTVQLRVNRRPVVDFLLGLGFSTARAHDKRIPEALFEAPTEIVGAFLRGLFDADGTVVNSEAKASRYVGLGSSSAALLRDVQMLLSTFGISARIYETGKGGDKAFSYTTVAGEDRTYTSRPGYDLRITGPSMAVFAAAIGFMIPTKSEKLAVVAKGGPRGFYTKKSSASLVERVDDGVEVTYNLCEPKNHSYIAGGIVVANCSEYTHIDDSACNLASLNLVTFWDDEMRSFDSEAFEHAVRLWTVTLEITVTMSHYPSATIAENSYAHRTLGLGYANLGALLMRAGLAYDSAPSRAAMGAITALLHDRAYATSAELAEAVGACAAWEANVGSMSRVLRNHRRAAYGSLADARGVPHYERLTVTPQGIDHLALAHTPFAALSDSVLAAADAMMSGVESGVGYRNAQATVLAPTGTIGLLMSCDTTGVEPDFALVKLKKLAGGGYMRIVNSSLPPALATLGYDEAARERIIAHALGTQTLRGDTPVSTTSLRAAGLSRTAIDAADKALANVSDLTWAFARHIVGDDAFSAFGVGSDDGADLLAALGFSPDDVEASSKTICGHLTVEGAPDLRPEHLAVFDCAVECGDGTRVIDWSGHVKALAAVAPHISGSVSKTVNMPNSVSVDDVMDAYQLSYDLGVKCVAIYRDGSKVTQPLNSAKTGSGELDDESDALVLPVEIPVGVSPTEWYRGQNPPRFRLPAMRPGMTWRLEVGGEEVYLRSGEYRAVDADGQPVGDGTLGEVFIDWGKQGSTLRGITSALSIMISQALQHGVPLERIVDALRGHTFEPYGVVQGHPNVKMASSLVDAIVRVLGHYYLGRDDLVQVPGGVTAATTASVPAPSRPAVAAVAAPSIPNADAPVLEEGVTADAETIAAVKRTGRRVYGKSCSNCGGSNLIQAGSCAVCGDCGETTGCS